MAEHLIILHSPDPSFVIDTHHHFDYDIDASTNLHTPDHDYYGKLHADNHSDPSLTLGYLADGHGYECTIDTSPSISCDQVTGTWN